MNHSYSNATPLEQLENAENYTKENLRLLCGEMLDLMDGIPVGPNMRILIDKCSFAAAHKSSVAEKLISKAALRHCWSETL